MRVHLHPQRRTVEVTGRRSVGRLLSELNVLPSTAMVIRRDELLTDGEMVEDDDEIEIRAVISGGSEGGRPSEHRASESTDPAHTGADRGFAPANPLPT
jgi:sulfur carrier protein